MNPKQTVRFFYGKNFELDVNKYLKNHEKQTIALITPCENGYIVVFNTNE